MSRLFYTTFLSFFMLIILGVNLAYTFDLVNVINPTSISNNIIGGGYDNYFFGFGSIQQNFDSYFTNSSVLTTLNKGMYAYSSAISKLYSSIQSLLNSLATLGGFSTSSAWELLSMVFTLLIFVSNIIPMVLMLGYAVFMVFILLVYIITFLLFIMSFFSGAFKTELPTIYPELNESLSIQMCILRCLPIG